MNAFVINPNQGFLKQGVDRVFIDDKSRRNNSLLHFLLVIELYLFSPLYWNDSPRFPFNDFGAPGIIGRSDIPSGPFNDFEVPGIIGRG